MEILSRRDLVDRPESWRVRGTDVLGRGSFTRLEQDHLLTPDDEQISREYLRHPGAVAVIAIDDEDRVALVRQYRHAVRHRLLEPPAGLLDVEGEDYLLAAQRELAEEVNLAAADWRVLVDLFTTPGIIGESLRIYLARGLAYAERPEGFALAGEEAHMDVVWAGLDDLADAVLAGDLHNPALVSGVLATTAARSRGGFDTLRPPDAPWLARDALPM